MLKINEIYQGDWIELSKQLDDESIDMIMTSPPYYGLRDYEIDGQIGLEEHPNLYIQKIVEGFRILKSKLKKTGSLYLNLGDTYFGNSSYSKEGRQGFENKDGMMNNQTKAYRSGEPDPKLPSRIRAREQFNSKIEDKDKGWLQAKQLMGIPWRIAIAMQEDGWILRNCIIWHKPNPMPSSVKDRLNNTYEFIFHFVKPLQKTTWLLDIPYTEKSKLSWLAGIIDGEGCIGISRQKHKDKHDVFSVYLSVANTCKGLLEQCIRITGFGNIETGKGTNLPIYIWRVNNKQASTIIAEVYSYLIAKKEQARICLALQETCKYRGNIKGENTGVRQMSDKEFNKKLELFELCKKAKRISVGFNTEPCINKTKGCAKYFYDLTPIREPHKDISIKRMEYGWHGTLCKNHKMSGIRDSDQLVTCNPYGKNPGDVFDIPTQSFSGAHFATFSEKLVLKPLLASCPQYICTKCGFIRERILKPTKEYKELLEKARKEDPSWSTERRKQAIKIGNAFYNKQKQAVASYDTIGWTKCDCNCEFKPGIVLDPFFGSGTVGLVALKNNRNFIGFELKPEYIKIAEDRLKPLLEQQKLVSTT